MLETNVNHVQPARPLCRVVASLRMYVIVAPQAHYTVQISWPGIGLGYPGKHITLCRVKAGSWLGPSGLCNMLETIVNHVQPARPLCRVVASLSMYVIVAPQAHHTVQGESRELAWAIRTLQHIGSNRESCAASRAAVQSGLLFWRWCARLVHKQVWSRSWSSHIHSMPSWTAEHALACSVSSSRH